jgi:DNA-binding ferritin-like protein (Dps family)
MLPDTVPALTRILQSIFEIFELNTTASANTVAGAGIESSCEAMLSDVEMGSRLRAVAILSAPR